MTEEIYVKTNIKTMGPFTMERLSVMINKNEISKSDLYFNSKNQIWEPIGNLNFADYKIENLSFSNYKPKTIQNDFGLSINNPIPIKGLLESKLYLSFLATPDGKRVKAQRIGGIQTTESGPIIDQYTIRDEQGLPIYDIFINAYAAQSTEEGPEGLIYFRPLKNSTVTKDFADKIKGTELEKTINQNINNLNKIDSIRKEQITNENQNVGFIGRLFQWFFEVVLTIFYRILAFLLIGGIIWLFSIIFS